MDVSCQGWRRSFHTHRLISGDISIIQASEPRGFYRRNKAYVEVEEDSVMISASAASLILHGDYMVQIRITRRDIAHLARVAFEGHPFGEVVEALSRKEHAVAAKTS